MENLKKERSVVRRLFTKTANDLESTLMEATKADKSTILSLYLKLKELFENLFKLDKAIKDALLENVEEDELEKEINLASEYKTRWLQIDVRFNELNRSTQSLDKNFHFTEVKSRTFKLPMLELQSFDGELKGWLPFWGQFSKIDADPSLDETEKYQYILQAMKEGSEVKRMVEGFPATAYKECIAELKSRYAREDLLIQIYIREILSLVLAKTDNIVKLYDQLNAQLRALETLNVTKEKYAAFLLPMVESALPQDIQRVWERNRQPGKDVGEELNNLLSFLKREVESEQRLEMTRKSFQCERPTTAECLIANTKPKLRNEEKTKIEMKNLDNFKKNLCIWCEKDNHASIECYKLNKMSLEERKKTLKEKKACPICLRRGHHPKVCRASVKCLICSKRHSTVLCSDQKQEQEEDDVTTKMAALASTDHKAEILLQTVIVELEHGGKKEKIRALLDSGSQRTQAQIIGYISE